MKKRKTFQLVLDDLDKLNETFDTQFVVGDKLKDAFDRAFNSKSKEEFVVTYKMPKSTRLMPRKEKSIYLEVDILNEYNAYVQKTYKLDSKDAVDRKLAYIFTSIAHTYVKTLK